MQPVPDPTQGAVRRIEVLDIWPATSTHRKPPRPSPPPPPEPPPEPPAVPGVDDTLFELVDHITTLSSLVTRTSEATSAELQALAGRLDRVAADVDALRRDLQADQRAGPGSATRTSAASRRRSPRR